MISKDRQDRANVEMRQINGVGHSVVERCGAIFEQGHHLGVDRTEDDQPSSNLIGLGSQSIYTSLQVRAELFVTLAIEVLELIEDEDVPSLCHRLQQLCKLQQVVGARISVRRHMECLQGVVHRREDTGWLGVWYLHIEDRLLAADFLHRLLNERRLADATTPRDLGKEPAFAGEHPLEIRKLLFATVELPVSHAVPVR